MKESPPLTRSASVHTHSPRRGAGTLVRQHTVHTFKRSDQALLAAAKAGQLSRLKGLLSDGVWIDTCDAASGETALHVAVRAGHQDVVRYLMKAGINHRVRDHAGQKALVYAKGPIATMLSRLITAAKYAQLDKALGISELRNQVLHLKRQFTRGQLLQSSPRPEGDSRPVGTSAQALSFMLPQLTSMFSVKTEWLLTQQSLIHACRRGDLPEVKTLLHQGANVYLLDEENTSALEAAVYSGHAELIRYIEQQLVDPPAYWSKLDAEAITALYAHLQPDGDRPTDPTYAWLNQWYRHAGEQPWHERYDALCLESLGAHGWQNGWGPCSLGETGLTEVGLQDVWTEVIWHESRRKFSLQGRAWLRLSIPSPEVHDEVVAQIGRELTQTLAYVLGQIAQARQEAPGLGDESSAAFTAPLTPTDSDASLEHSSEHSSPASMEQLDAVIGQIDELLSESGDSQNQEEKDDERRPQSTGTPG